MRLKIGLIHVAPSLTDQIHEQYQNAKRMDIL